MATGPDYVQDFLKHVPNVWDDLKFLDGFPGKFVVLARRGDRRNRWYVAGINGEASAKTVTLDLNEFIGDSGKTGWLITDGSGGDHSFQREIISLSPHQKRDFNLKPHGGFVLVLE